MAVAGIGFSVGVVAQMLGMAVFALLDPVDECQAAGFLVAGDRPGDYRFSHALVRSAVVAQLSAADQRRWHVAAADAIECLYQGQLRPHLAELAHHRVAGSLPGDRLDAVRACQAAGKVAAEDLAFEEAARLYRQALSVGAGEISDAGRGQLELALAGALYRGGDVPGWHDTLTGLAQRAERRGDHVLLARAGLEMDPLGDTGWDSEIGRICERALAGPELDGPLRARVMARHAQVLVYRGEYGRADEVSRTALDGAELTGDPDALVDALRARQLARSGPDGSGERAVIAARMLDAAHETGSAWVEMWGRLWRIDTLFEAGQLPVISRELADLAICAGRMQAPVARWHLLQYSATHAARPAHRQRRGRRFVSRAGGAAPWQGRRGARRTRCGDRRPGDGRRDLRPDRRADQIPAGFPHRDRLVPDHYREENGDWLDEGNTVIVAPSG